MKRLLILLATVALQFGLQAEEVYHVHPLSEGETLQMYTALMRDACRHSDAVWSEWKADPRGGYWGSGRSDNMNEGVRAISEMVLTCGSLLRYSDVFTPEERRDYTTKCLKAIRYSVDSHLTGPQVCTDGKHWGNSWQSAMWTGTLAFGAWLIWDDLDAGLRKDLERVVGYEADRFLKDKPPGGSWNDTKAEENGWNLICISTAVNMFPQNPHAAAWNEKLIEYAINTLSAPQDEHDKHKVDGRPISEWYSGANIHPDFTLENHGFFHPSYVACSSYFLTETAMHFTYAHRPIPEAAAHHLMDTWHMYQKIVLPCGETAYPQGMDWELHGLPYLNLYASLAAWQKDPLAAHFEKEALQYMRAWQNMCNGDLTVPGSRLGFTRHASCAEQASYGFLAHKIFGAPVKELSARKAASKLSGADAYAFEETVFQRSDDKFVSVSWTNRIMGLLMPIGPGHDSNPDFAVPMVNGLVGSFDLVPKGDPKAKSTVSKHHWKTRRDGFETTATLRLNEGRLQQHVSITSLGKKALVYQDRVTALHDVTVTREQGVPIAIENDSLTGGTRTVSYAEGSKVCDWKQTQRPFAVSGTWANVDGRLGVVTVEGSGIHYQQAGGYDHVGIYPDVLCASYSDHKAHYTAGQEVAHRVAVFFVEVTPKETAALAKSVHVENTSRGKVLKFKLPEGGEREVPLL